MTPNRTITILGSLLIGVSFICGIVIFLLVQSLATSAKIKEDAQRASVDIFRKNQAAIPRFGVILAMTENQVLFETFPSTIPVERFLFFIMPETQLVRRDAIVTGREITGFRQDEEGELSDITVGKVIYVTMEPRNDVFIARRILFGDPFPVP